jgi:NAD(P)-dependent dehydrogenase (short-subunit alcohol dehydrogenase family)
MDRIAGRTALVTGAGQGIGRAVAHRLAREGARVLVNDLDPVTAARTADEVGGLAAPFDCADPAAVRRAVAAQQPIDLLIANHAFMTMAPFLEVDPGEWRRMLEVNLLGTAWLVCACGPPMAERGFGRIVCIASEWGVTGWPNATAYAATKGGIVSLVRSAAQALGPRGVAVNAIAPGVTDTPQLDVDALDAGVSHEEMAATYARDIPLGRIGRPGDIAAVAAFLCSTAAEALVGQVLMPNGGYAT